MQITIDVPDAQWQEFQELAKENVDQNWSSSYKDFATYIMLVNFENYISARKRKQEKEYKKALAAEKVRVQEEGKDK